MGKIKLIQTKNPLVRGLSIQVVPEVYDKLDKIAHDLKTSKKVVINTALVKFFDDIEELGVEL